MIAALVLEPFELWWARRLRPELRDAPLVAVREGRVRHATPEARREGITPGMSLSGAKLRCEELQVTQPSEAELRAGWENVLRELYGLTPFLDGSRRGRALLGLPLPDARTVAEVFDGRVGYAAGREIAEVAALSIRPGHCRALPEGNEEEFLARLPLRFLNGVGLSGYSLQRLRWLGLETAGELARWRRGQLKAFLGDEAGLVAPYLHAPWEDRLPLARPPEAVRRTARFEEPLFEPGPIGLALQRLAQALEEALAGRSSRRLTVSAEVAGVEMRATRFAKKPLREARDIELLAGLALEDAGAAPVGIEALTIELPEPVRLASQGRLWPAKERREAAREALLERFPQTAVEVEWLDPYAESSDLIWRWRHPAGEEEASSSESPTTSDTSTSDTWTSDTWTSGTSKAGTAETIPATEGAQEEVEREESTAAGTGDARRQPAQPRELVFGKG